MGLALSSLWTPLFSKPELKIVIIGLDNAGKTTILYKITQGEVIATAPTVGSNSEQFEYKNLRFALWDIGGQTQLRQSWAAYYTKARAVILAVDSCDKDRLPIVREELHRAMADEQLKDSLLLVWANKQDRTGQAATAAQISEALGLTNLRDRQWSIFACSALTGKGLEEGLDWLTDKLA